MSPKDVLYIVKFLEIYVTCGENYLNYDRNPMGRSSHFLSLSFVIWLSGLLKKELSGATEIRARRFIPLVLWRSIWSKYLSTAFSLVKAPFVSICCSSAALVVRTLNSMLATCLRLCEKKIRLNGVSSANFEIHG